MPKHLLCTPHLHLMHEMEFLSTPVLHGEHGNMEVSIATVLLPVQNAFTFTFNPFSVINFFHCTYFISTSFQLSLSSIKSSASRTSFTLTFSYILCNLIYHYCKKKVGLELNLGGLLLLLQILLIFFTTNLH